MPLECSLFCEAFDDSDPGSIGRRIANLLDVTSRTEGRTVWIHKKRGQREATAVFAPSITRDQIKKLINGSLEFKSQPVRCDEVRDVAEEPNKSEDEGSRPGKKLRQETIEELCLPWESKPYQEQLQEKREIVANALSGALKGVKASAKQRRYTPTPAWDDLVIEDTLYTELPDGYRNKCEFTFGLTADGMPEVGFMHTRATATTEPVVAPGETLMHVSSNIAPIVVSLRSLLTAHIERFPLFSHRTKIGFWRLVSIRACPNTGECQVVIQSGPASDDWEATAFENILTAWAQESSRITSLFVQYNSSVTDTLVLSDLHVMKRLIGPESISMAIGDRARFQVHPLSFFQTNSKGCELLYNQVASWLPGGSGVLLDICCGVGTIGQYVALSRDDVSVVGVDIVTEAIKDAEANATLNGLESNRVVYHAGRAEEVLPAIISSTGARLAVVDPPRSGLHKNVIRAIRETEEIDTLVYVSCNPKTLETDLVKFCEPLTSCAEEEGVAVNHRFIPTKAVAVDMFPNTVHCEVVVLLQRPRP